MGAESFIQIVIADNPEEAFNKGVEQAQYDYGHSGYTGSLAEKDGFIIIDVPEGYTPEEYAYELHTNGDDRINDKWGPAGIIKVNENEYLIFGWAPS